MATCPSMPKPHPSCQKCPPAGQCRCAVDLASGASEIQKTYLQTEHGEVSLRWFNQYDQSGSLQNPNRGLGTNWFSPSLGYVVIEEGCAVVVLSPGRAGKTHYFMADGSGGYTPCYCAREQFDQLADGSYRLADEDGTLSYFRESDHTLERVIPPGRVGETQFVYEGTQLRQQRREYTSSGQPAEQTVELRYFEYNADGWISSITLQRHTNRNAQPGDAGWTLIRRLELEYYQDSDAYGNRGDLKSVTEQVPDPDSPGEWTDDKTGYYRYYKPGEAGGYEHGLKYVVSPEGTKLLENHETATNEEVAQHAAQYFKYDEVSRRVTLARTSGGVDTFEIGYTENEGLGFVDYNHWTLKADMKTADGALKTVYSNHIGQDLLIDLCSEADDEDCVHWVSHWEYGPNARVTEEHSPTSVLGYDEEQDNLGVTLKSDGGLIRIYEYYTDTGSGQAEGYLEAEFVKCGTNSVPLRVKIRDYEYDERIDNPDGRTITVYRVNRQTEYHAEDPGSAAPTGFRFEYYPGTSQPERITTDSSHVPPHMNGVGYPQFDTTVEEYDEVGRLTAEIDGEQVRTEYEYDEQTGTRSKMIQDTGGLGLETTYEVDDLGRVTAEIGLCIRRAETGRRSVRRRAPVIWTRRTRSGLGKATGRWERVQSMC